MKYLSWQEETITDFDEKNISEMYARGFVFTRVGKGVMQQTRAVRIDLAKFELSSENRRILKKIGAKGFAAVEKTTSKNIDTFKNSDIGEVYQKVVDFNEVTKKEVPLPLSTADYHWSIAKMAKDFYQKKFGDGVMSAAKIKELLTNDTKSNFNSLLTFGENAGYAICYKNSVLLHYSYPFYDLEKVASGEIPKDIGLGMMILAIEHAQKAGLRYIYLGSLQRPGDTYKLQFKGLEWYDGGPDGTAQWLSDIEKAKNILK